MSATPDYRSAAEGSHFCGRCGEVMAGFVAPPGGEVFPVQGVSLACGSACRDALGLEPPRFCSLCGRRMKVQVDPFGWEAVCVKHGSLSS
ncbi:hypothetical protein JT358_03415 [Micrococcales bacterium 31B]|nr:hypothetical protein [Micrococcales bacterium 31B]